MAKPVNVDWAAVRMLAVAVEVREAARQMQITEDATTLETRRLDGCPIAIAQRALAKPCHQRVTKCPAPADALGNVLQQHEHETELWLAMSKIQVRLSGWSNSPAKSRLNYRW